MELCRYFPKPSDRMGMLWTLSSIEDIYIIEFGPAGTTHFAIEGTMQLNGDSLANIYTTDIDETDISLGKQDRLEKAILEVDKKYNPKYIFIMASSISAIIGTDIKSVCYELEDYVNSKLIPIDTGGYNGDFTLGVENALDILCRNCILDKENIKSKRYNVIGNNMDLFNFKDDLKELERLLLNAFGYRSNTIFTANTSIDKIENTLDGEFNIVFRREGIKSAKYLEDRYNMKYIIGRPYGIGGTTELLRLISNIMDIEIDESFIKEEVDKIRKYIMEFKMFLNEVENRDIVLIGHFDTIMGLKNLVEELGFNVEGLIVNHGLSKNFLKGLDEEILSILEVDLSEEEMDEYFKNKDLFLLMGDGTSIRYIENIRHHIQISNPNLVKNNIFSDRPFLGYSGVLYFMSKVMEMEKEKIYK